MDREVWGSIPSCMEWEPKEDENGDSKQISLTGSRVQKERKEK